jgi:hypothetical protein
MVCREVDIEEEVEASFWGDLADVTDGHTSSSILCRKIDPGFGDIQRQSSAQG